ncbi:MAG: 16S rRNA (cytosine(1402)-N(4))-methyltransferase RsmH [Candidatus Omnitrophica bacterium]|nr:16S rRNA (cytosine(1402)-N(4))-methyltransferase RsmH [Candidatus Omnitrophota bacterium]MDD5653068.1 16S rRNA (cytosine(1402)-N(4))-methyltransferase RsmH [Candidatus Omnitrophota bacterium]
MIQAKYHLPVMLGEVIDHLNLAPGKVIVDATLGTAGHSLAILEKITPGGRLIGIDRDQDALKIAGERLSKFKDSTELVYGNFAQIDKILGDLKVKKIDGIIFDLGISSVQLEDPQRGFSFQSEGPLDMRLDQNSYISAYDLVNNLNEEEISTLLRNFGEERWSNRIARYLVRERQKHAISTTRELSEVVIKALPYKFRYYRIHPATRTFQAIRIAVNRELETLQAALDKTISFLNHKARICVISFHSLEDRIVKFSFRKFASDGLIKIITPKPLVPTDEEIKNNPSSRSSKLRVGERA